MQTLAGAEECVSLLEALTQSLFVPRDGSRSHLQPVVATGPRAGVRVRFDSEQMLRWPVTPEHICDCRLQTPPFQWAGLPSAAAPAFCASGCVCVCVCSHRRLPAPECESKQQTFVFSVWPSALGSYSSHLGKHETLGTIWVFIY